MLNPTYQVERPAAAGSSRALACDVAAPAFVGGTSGRIWAIAPSAMTVPATKHGLTPAPRPEEAVPR